MLEDERIGAKAEEGKGLLLNAIQVNDHSVGFFEVINVSE